MHTPRVAVLGAGSWGTALAALAASQAPTQLWARDAAVVQVIQTTRHHPRYLPDIALPTTLHTSADLTTVVQHALPTAERPGLIILGVPVAGLADMCAHLASLLCTLISLQPTASAAPTAGLAILWTCKGFDRDTGQLPHQRAEPHFARLIADAPFPLGLGVLSGPSFAQEVARGLPVALTVAAQQTWVPSVAVAAMHGTNARIYSSTDVTGVEVGGALKNVIAIACGIADGLALGDNARAALITRGLAEIQRLGLALGGQASTFAGLTGLGDLVLTATGALSRNRQVGLALAAGQPLAQILATGITAEGVRCARAAQQLGQQTGVDMPITNAVCSILFEGTPPRQAVSALLARQSRAETTSS